MTDESDLPSSPEAEPTPEPSNPFLGLDLTPDWARGAPGIQSQAPERAGRNERPEGPGVRAPGESARRGLQGLRVKPRRDPLPRRDEGAQREFPRDDAEGGPRGRGERPAPPPRLPVHVDFIPEKNTLSKVVRVIRQSHRVYSLEKVARMFMDKPQSLAVKYTLRENVPEAADFWFYQCTVNGMVFTRREDCEAYIIERGLGAYYESETREVPPPTGNFICVGRHRSTGRLIGPPNWHGYQRRLEELRQEVAPGIDPSRFTSQVEMVHEAEAIEAWKKEVSVQTFWRRKAEALPTAPAVESATESGEENLSAPTEAPSAPEEAPAPAPEPAPFTLTRDQAEAEFREKIVPALIHKSRRVLMPGYLIPVMVDPALASLTRFHLEREHRQPGSIIFALRPAFKHMRLHIFRHDGQMYVSGVEPHPLPHDQKVIPEIRGILDYVEGHPGCPAKDALLAVRGETGEPTPEMASHFRWLIEKGHLLEFEDGSLQLPHSRA